MQEPALELVIAALEKIRETRDRLPHASRAALSCLQSIAPEIDLARAAPAPNGGEDGAARKAELLAAIQERVRVCTKCQHLACSRTQTVFGVGNPDAELMFIGEAPGADEDAQGEPFVGRAGQLLTKIIKAMGFAREDVYIANIWQSGADTGRDANLPPLPGRTDRGHSAESRGRTRRSRGRGLARHARDDARIARTLSQLQSNAAHDHLPPGISAPQSESIGKAQSVGRHAASVGALGEANQRSAAKLFSVAAKARRRLP